MKKIATAIALCLLIVFATTFSACFTVEMEDEFKGLSFVSATQEFYDEITTKISGKRIFNTASVIEYDYRKKVVNDEGDYFVSATAYKTEKAGQTVIQGSANGRQAVGCIGCASDVALYDFYYTDSDDTLFVDSVRARSSIHAKEKMVVDLDALSIVGEYMMDLSKTLTEILSGYSLSQVKVATVGSKIAVKLVKTDYSFESGIQTCDNMFIIDANGTVLAIKTYMSIVDGDGATTEIAVTARVSSKTVTEPTDLSSYQTVTEFKNYYK